MFCSIVELIIADHSNYILSIFLFFPFSLSLGQPKFYCRLENSVKEVLTSLWECDPVLGQFSILCGVKSNVNLHLGSHPQPHAHTHIHIRTRTRKKGKTSFPQWKTESWLKPVSLHGLPMKVRMMHIATLE